MSERLRVYTVRIMAADGERLDEDQDEALDRAIGHAEDTINDALPDGFYVKFDEEPLPITVRPEPLY